MADVTTERNVDFPTLGNPTKPTSAKSLSSSINSFSSPGSPSWAKRGACLVGVAKWEFPRPPLPPLRSKTSWFGSDKSANTSSVFASLITVPIGTGMYRSFPLLPYFLAPSPLLPFSALNFFLYLNSIKVFASLSTLK